MATRVATGLNVFDESVERMLAIYREGHRVVVSFSAGKDSTCCLNVCLIAAGLTNRLPVEVVLQDEEIGMPGTYEYAERIAKRDDVDFNWLVMNQPMLNCFNRAEPYFWVFDQKLSAEEWVRQPPSFAKYVQETDISMMTIPERFPPPPGKELYAVVGLRASESRGRMYGVFSSGGYLTKPDKRGVRRARPIYDWNDSDVWKAIQENGWDYNSAYNVMHKMGVKPKALRIGPPTMNSGGLTLLTICGSAWPKWFDKVCTRLPGVRTAVQFGRRTVEPRRRLGESWEQCFKRECITDAPKWIADRSRSVMEKLLSTHAHHSTQPLPETSACYTCFGHLGSWRQLAHSMFGGDPFSTKQGMLPWVEPNFFRPGAGTWERK